ncbi:hypothetical protein RFI_35152 [Reticulomyxa filosa]|uniref:FUN14 family protein n=1 Tax=Reticulomyxa filosa TaxID=46433 RepID=X6LNI8_RETFI|nr:hypothetical protein RFI_35152 [Reticulomyxa filosa]|eukprot:ETO02285.1 hypothetical protein RFI_35152 [Reticulomyxa filosa]
MNIYTRESQPPVAYQYNMAVDTHVEPGSAGHSPNNVSENESENGGVRVNVNGNVDGNKSINRSQVPSQASVKNLKAMIVLEQQDESADKLSDVLSSAIANEDVQRWLLPYAQIFTVGGGVGFASGLVIKKLGGTAVKYGVGTALAIQLLSYSGYIDFNWEKIKTDINTVGDRLHGTQAMQFIVTNIGPILAGFGLGMHFG